jgi:ABC-type multidrug transport system fused ATPase/permease subunit
MIFLKNIIYKKGIKGYLITLFIIIMFSLCFISLSNYLSIYRDSLLNDLTKRTIYIYDSYNCDNEIEHVVSCYYKDDLYNLIIDDSKNVANVVSLLDEEYDLIAPDFSNDNINDIIVYIKYLSVFIFIICMILIFVMIYQFYRDDIKINKILRCIGYSKKKIYTYNILAYIFVVSILFILSYILFVLSSRIFNIDANINMNYISVIYLLQYIFVSLMIVIEYSCIFISFKKYRIK